MGRTAFIFPGQGAQYPGMGKDFYDSCDKAREVFETSAKVTGLDMEKLVFTENEVQDCEEHIRKPQQIRNDE